MPHLLLPHRRWKKMIEIDVCSILCTSLACFPNSAAVTESILQSCSCRQSKNRRSKDHVTTSSFAQWIICPPAFSSVYTTKPLQRHRCHFRCAGPQLCWPGRRELVWSEAEEQRAGCIKSASHKENGQFFSEWCVKTLRRKPENTFSSFCFLSSFLLFQPFRYM